MFNPEDVKVTTPVSPTMYVSALHQYLINTDNKIVEQEHGAVTGSKNERLFQLLVQYVQHQSELIINLKERVKELEGHEALHKSEIERTLEVLKQIDRDNENA